MTTIKVLVVLSLILASAYTSKLQKGRIINGELANERQFPFMVGLSSQKYGGTAWCGGALISPEWILTAAHCVDKSDGTTAFLGMTKMGRAKHTISINASDVIKHEDYGPLRNDIALIRINPVELSDAVSTISLANSSVTYENSRAIAAGWGRTSDAHDSVNLLHTTLIVEPLSECTSTYGGPLYEDNLCASTKSGSSPCYGDSGGPLISRLDRTLIGVSAFVSVRGCKNGEPVGFTRVSSYLDWIKTKTGLKQK